MKRAAVLIILLAALAGCGHPLIPRAAVASHPVTTPTPQTAIIGANGPVVGVNLYALRNYSAATVRTDGARMLSYIKKVLHADAVDIVWNFYATSTRANTVIANSATLSASNAGILTGIAQRDQLMVEYRPLIMVNAPNPWEGNIHPASPARWFDSYYSRNLPYLRMAEKYHVNEYVTATEMKALNSSPHWPLFFQRIGQVYHGVISYAAEAVDYFPPGTRLLPVNYVGMDMYEKLTLPPSASTAQVTAAYESFFSHVPASVLRRTAIQETGIQARAGAYQSPAVLFTPGSLDEAVQANWFTAACSTLKRYHMRAVFFWKVDLTDYPITHPASSLSTFEGKEGAQAIGRCTSVLHS